jgi:S-DNA-T family DNA segregation ATPase FtsK/SpoIIIE
MIQEALFDAEPLTPDPCPPYRSLPLFLGTSSDVPARTRQTPAGRVVTVAPAIHGGEAVWADLRRAPHILVSGTTGSGKSVALHNVICQLIALPVTEANLVLIDPKRVEFGVYRSSNHLTGPLGPGCLYRDAEESAEALAWVLHQIERRLYVMERCGMRDASGVPDQIWTTCELGARSLVLLVDELADLTMTLRDLSRTSSAGRRRSDIGPAQSGGETSLARILQLGRAAGVHAVLATQRPSVDVVTGVIKANVPSRLAFALQSATDSRVALGQRGAEELSGMGDALWLPVGARMPVRMQGAVAPTMAL